MPDMIADACRWLAGQLKASASQPVTYRRGSASVVVQATLRQEILRVATGNVARVERPDAVAVFPAADLVLGGIVVEPAAGDVFEVAFGTVKKRFRLTPMHGEPAWRYTDPFQVEVLVRGKQVSQSDQTTILVSPASLPDGTAGVAYSQQLTSAGGIDGGTFTATGLPPGLTLSVGGLLAGTPTLAGAYTPRVTATDAVGDSGFRDYTLHIS